MYNEQNMTRSAIYIIKKHRFMGSEPSSEQSIPATPLLTVVKLKLTTFRVYVSCNNLLCNNKPPCEPS